MSLLGSLITPLTSSGGSTTGTINQLLANDGAGGFANVNVGSGLNYNTGTNTLTATGSGGSSAFNDITSGANTTAAMVVGSGASIGSTGTGTVQATSISTADETTDTTCFPVFATASGSQASQNLKTNTGFTFNSSTGAFGVTSAIIGDPGTEGSGINVVGVTFNSSFKVSDIDGTNYAQTILHRHSTTLEPVIVGARSNSDTSSHADVTNGQGVFSLYGVGWAGSNYKFFGSFTIGVDDTGTISNTSSPGKWTFNVTPNGSTTPATWLTVTNDSKATFGGALSVTGHTTFEGVTSTGATGTGKLVYDDSPAFTGSPTAPTQSQGDNSTKLATTAYADTGLANNLERIPGQSGAVSATKTSGIACYEFTGAGSLVLPTAVGNSALFMVKNRHSANITVTFTGGQNADGSTSISIAPYQALQFVSNNSNYNIF